MPQLTSPSHFHFILQITAAQQATHHPTVRAPTIWTTYLLSLLSIVNAPYCAPISWRIISTKSQNSVDASLSSKLNQERRRHFLLHVVIYKNIFSTCFFAAFCTSRSKMVPSVRRSHTNTKTPPYRLSYSVQRYWRSHTHFFSHS